MRQGITIVLSGLLIGLAASSCGGLDSDGFDGPSGAETTELRGRLLQPGAEEPATDAAVYLHRGDERVGRTLTDESGEFVFKGVRGGRHRLAANDGRGHGLLGQHVLFAGGAHDLGDFELKPLPEIPGVVDSHGIGFEERVTTGEGNWDHPVYSSDRQKVYAFRKTEGPEAPDLVQVDTSTGEQEVLLRDPGFSSEGSHRRELALADDRYLTFIRRDGDESSRVVYDVDNRSVVFDSLTRGLETQYAPSFVMTSEELVFALVADTEEVTEWDGSGTTRSPAEKVRFVSFNLETEEVRKGPWVDGKWVTGLLFGESTDHMIAYKTISPCSGDTREFAECDSNDWDDYYFDLDNRDIGRIIRTDRSIDRYPDSASVDVPGEDRAMYVQSAEYLPPDSDEQRPATKVTRFDPEEHDGIAHAEHRWKIEPCDGCASPAVDVVGSPPLVYVWMSKTDSHADRTPHELLAIDPEDGERTELTPTVEVDDRTIELCEEACRPYTVGDGIFRVEHLFERSDGDWWGAMVDYRDGEVVDRRVFDIWESGDGPARYDDDVHTAADSDVEAMRLRRGGSGFFQYFVRRSPDAPDLDRFVRRTYVSAHHRYAAFTPDGRTLFYFTRDPVSGFDQLFRLRLDALPTETLRQHSSTPSSSDG